MDVLWIPGNLLNAYAYCSNNPINYIDPLGLSRLDGPLGDIVMGLGAIGVATTCAASMPACVVAITGYSIAALDRVEKRANEEPPVGDPTAPTGYGPDAFGSAPKDSNVKGPDKKDSEKKSSETPSLDVNGSDKKGIDSKDADTKGADGKGSDTNGADSDDSRGV